jgi:hypothetical protein
MAGDSASTRRRIGYLGSCSKVPLPPEVNGPHQLFFRRPTFGALNLQQNRVRDQGVADRARHHDHSLGPMCLVHEGGNVELGAWAGASWTPATPKTRTGSYAASSPCRRGRTI